MKWLLLFLVFSAFLMAQCGGKKTNVRQTASLPACIQHLLDSGGSKEVPTNAVRVDEYIYKGKKTYLLIPGCCDNYNLLFDEDCNKIGAPSGGFSGRGDGTCPDFDSTSKRVRTIWPAGDSLEQKAYK